MRLLLESYTDIHTHILPGLDDGARNIEEALSMVAIWAENGVKQLVATPHFLPGTAWASAPEMIQSKVTQLQQKICDAGLNVRVLPGMEIAYHRKLESSILSGKVIPLGDSGYFLIEPSFQGEDDTLLISLRKLLKEGYKIILAHPERKEGLQTRIYELTDLVQRGLLLQINIGSLLGVFGTKSKNAAYKLYENNCSPIIASDAHDTRRRLPLTQDQLENIVKETKSDRIVTESANIVQRIFPVSI